MDRKDFEKKYWLYYLSLESKLLQLQNFISFDNRNGAVFSNELVSLILLFGSEIDVVFKAVCGYPGSNVKNMGDYKIDLKRELPSITSEKVKVDYFDFEVQPFADLDSSLVWWKAYNSVKHDRLSSIEQASLNNVLQIAAGLFLLLRLYLRKEVGEEEYLLLRDSSHLFHTVGWGEQPNFKFGIDSDGNMALVYDAE